MSNDNLAGQLCHQVEVICVDRYRRYRLLWIVGGALSGKSSLCRTLCRQTGWQYVNYTLDDGYLSIISGREETYRPDDFLTDLDRWCQSCQAAVLVLDEIEPLLSLWQHEQQEDFFRRVSRQARLACGVVLVTRLRSALELTQLVPNSEHIFDVAAQR